MGVVVCTVDVETYGVLGVPVVVLKNGVVVCIGVDVLTYCVVPSSVVVLITFVVSYAVVVLNGVVGGMCEVVEITGVLTTLVVVPFTAKYMHTSI